MKRNKAGCCWEIKSTPVNWDRQRNDAGRYSTIPGKAQSKIQVKNPVMFIAYHGRDYNHYFMVPVLLIGT